MRDSNVVVVVLRVGVVGAGRGSRCCICSWSNGGGRGSIGSRDNTGSRGVKGRRVYVSFTHCKVY